MKSRNLFLALLFCSGCRTSSITSDSAAGPAQPARLANRVWTRSDPSGLPGILRIFLADGTLVQDSCWETYRLSQWRMPSERTLVWQEDGRDISAEILVLNEKELVLQLDLVDGSSEERYTAAPVPYVCPDLPR